MFCRYCGKPIVEDSEFCTYCGKSLYGVSTINKTENLSKFNNFFVNNISLLVKLLCYTALCVFLFFNIKMAPFYSWWKFLAYIVEGAVAVGLVILTNRKIVYSSSMKFKVFSLIFSFLIILFSIVLRVIYDTKVEMAEKDVPNSGTILVDVNWDTEYYSYISQMVYDPSTSVRVDGVGDYAKITLGEPVKLELTLKGNNQEDYRSDIITLYSSNFKNGKYIVSKSMDLGDGTSAKVDVELRRYCTFWEVIFY